MPLRTLHRPGRWAGVAVSVAVPALLLSGCGASPRTTATEDRYTQTWAKSYDTTTCSDWTDSMTAAQQWAAAADMLTGARNKGDKGTGLPTDSLVTTFQEGITTACVVPTAKLTDIAVGLYLTERATFRP